MPRPFKRRCVNGRPTAIIYKPAGIPARGLNWIQLNLDEYESIRLIDHLGMDQEQAAQQMGVSRPTVTRIYASARKKIADALVEGCALEIGGGPETIQSQVCPGRHRQGRHGQCGRGQRSDNSENQSTMENEL